MIITRLAQPIYKMVSSKNVFKYESHDPTNPKISKEGLKRERFTKYEEIVRKQ